MLPGRFYLNNVLILYSWLYLGLDVTWKIKLSFQKPQLSRDLPGLVTRFLFSTGLVWIVYFPSINTKNNHKGTDFCNHSLYVSLLYFFLENIKHLNVTKKQEQKKPVMGQILFHCSEVILEHQLEQFPRRPKYLTPRPIAWSTACRPCPDHGRLLWGWAQKKQQPSFAGAPGHSAHFNTDTLKPNTYLWNLAEGFVPLFLVFSR